MHLGNRPKALAVGWVAWRTALYLTPLPTTASASYSGSEGTGLTLIDSHEALRHPGSVSRVRKGVLHIVDESGHALPPGRRIPHHRRATALAHRQAATASTSNPGQSTVTKILVPAKRTDRQDRRAAAGLPALIEKN